MQKKNETNEKNPMSFIQKKIPIDITQLKTILNPNNNHGVCGSINLGNTCYMNSSIACLSNCTELTTFFLSKEYKTFKNTSNKNGLNGKLAEEWYSLLKDYWKSNKTHGNPKNIKNLVAKKDKKFEGYEFRRRFIQSKENFNSYFSFLFYYLFYSFHKNCYVYSSLL